MAPRLAVLAAALPFALAASGHGSPPAPPSDMPGDGRDGRCDGYLPSAFERRVIEGQRFRAQFGLPADRAHVVAVTKDRRNRDASGEFPPLDPAERRYMSDRLRVQDRIGRIADYVNRNAKGISGGLSIEDDYPRGAYVKVRLTRELDRHAGPLSSLGLRIQLAQVRYTESQLDRASDGFIPKVEALRRERIYVLTWGTDIDLNAVEVEYVSARPDAKAVVESRLGPLAHATLVATTRYAEVCTPARRYRVGRSGRTLRVGWRTFRAYKRARVEAHETRRTVQIAVIEKAPYGPIPLLGKRPTALVRLKDPLGKRRVIDAETGRRLRRR